MMHPQPLRGGPRPGRQLPRRRAGVAALADFGGVGWSARAEEDLGRWLVTQGRGSDAETPLGHAREVYREIGVDGWLARLDTWLASHALTDN